MDEMDRHIINLMQENFPVCDRPFAVMAGQLGMQEIELMGRVRALLDDGTLSRFGPLYNIEKLGGVYCLVAMSVPEHDLDQVINIINACSEVAHNYERTHAFNLWFVLAAESDKQLRTVLEDIEKQTAYPAYAMPKLEEFYVGLKFDA